MEQDVSPSAIYRNQPHITEMTCDWLNHREFNVIMVVLLFIIMKVQLFKIYKAKHSINKRNYI